MPTFENIDGNRLLTIFQELIRHKILVKVYLPRTDFESLTLIIETNESDRQPIFKIDVPAGLHQALAETKSKRLAFEFNSYDQVTHRFVSVIHAISGRTISLSYPTFIQRHQQRDNFRVRVPSNSFAYLSIDDLDIQMEMENISQGGAYCYCLNKFKPVLTEGMKINELELVFAHKRHQFAVSVQRAVIKRMESSHRPKQFGIAIEFIKIKRHPKLLLVQLIYEMQRSFLQSRHKTV